MRHTQYSGRAVPAAHRLAAFKRETPPPFDSVSDLQKYIQWIGASVAFAPPATIVMQGAGWTATLGLIAGVARVVVVQHRTFCINSLCHYS
jgi:stearoyl-CoA desaturase (delta-9 desaturase)